MDEEGVGLADDVFGEGGEAADEGVHFGWMD